MKKIPIKVISEIKPFIPEFDTKHLSVFNEIKNYLKKPFKQHEPVDVEYAITKKTKICFILLPEWDKTLPPYNVSRLIAVSRNAGYETSGIDLNIEAWHDSKKWRVDTDFWHPSSEWKWTGDSYWEMIHPHLHPLLDKTLDSIVNSNIDVVGLTLYYCNLEISNWFAEELKKRKPSIKIMVGGPQAHHSYWTPSPHFDFIVSGEGEENLLLLLEKIESGNDKKQWIRQSDGIRIDLDAVPSPDFSWVDFSKYDMPNGILMEFSRGCIAKCTFCGETHFWKYRYRQSDRVIKEIEFLNKNYGIDTIWFLDSLVNGNLKELRKFSKEIISKNLKIYWTGYARCDKRMDLDYYKDLSKSGCVSLNYGIESGSNKVLQDMAKGITVSEVERNLEDGKTVGIRAMTNWIVGFPTETTQDFYETLTLIVRNYKNIHEMSPGTGGFVVSSDTIVGQNFDRFNLYRAKWENEWLTKDFKNTKLHRLMRQKIFLLIMAEVGHDSGYPKNFYKIKYYSKKNKHIDYESFDFDIVQNKNLNKVAESFINEIFVVLRLLWRWKGPFSLTMTFDKDSDWQNFGDRLGCNFNGSVNFVIDILGKWKLDIDYDFKQTDSWKYHSYEEANSVAADRAKRLSKRQTKEYTYEDLCQDMKVVQHLSEHDFSFAYKNSHSGNWL